MGIRNLLAENLQNSVRIIRFGNGLPRQSADWLAMTGFFDSLKSTPGAVRRGCLFSYFEVLYASMGMSSAAGVSAGALPSKGASSSSG